MCIAIYKPANKEISTDTLKRCWDVNSDGAGFMYSEDKKLHIHKGFMSFDAFHKTYRHFADKSIVLHFRIKTHGKIAPDNTHPFQVGDNLAFVHNGIISAVDTKPNPDFSDTYHFNKQILHKLYASDNRFIKKKHFQDLIKEFIGYSKLVFMDNRGRVTIVNEDKGQWDNGIWYSNTSYQEPRYNPKSKRTKQSSTNLTPEIIRPANWKPLSIGDRVYVQIDARDEPRFGNISYFGSGTDVGVKLDEENATIVFPGFAVYRSIITKDDLKQDFLPGDWITVISTGEVGEVAYVNPKNCNVKFTNGMGLTRYRFISNNDLELLFREEGELTE